METNQPNQRKFGIYQGWIVVAAVMLTLAIASGGRFLYGVVLIPVTEEFGWTRAQVALGMTLSVIFMSTLQPIVGWLVDRIGSRKVLLVGLTCTILAMLPLTMATKLWQIYLFYGVLAAFGFATVSPVNVTALVSGWFVEKRGLALSLATSGTAYGQLLIIPIATAIMFGYGWRMPYYVIAITLACLIMPLAFFFIRDSPSSTLLRQGRNSGVLDEPRVSLSHAIRGAAYWQLSFGMLVCGVTMGFTQVHMIPYLLDMHDHSGANMHATAGIAMSIVGGGSILGSLVLGYYSDRAGHRQILALTYFLRGLAFLVLLLVADFVPGIFIAAMVLGISWTSTTPLTSAIAANIYGRASLATIFGFIFTPMNIGSGIGAYVAGLDRDITGSYTAMLIANIFLGFAAAAVIWTIKVKPLSPVHRPSGRPDSELATSVAD